jgi:hypothetical protein
MFREDRRSVWPSPQNDPPSAESLATISNVVLSAFIMMVLDFGRDLLVPLTLSALPTFMLPQQHLRHLARLPHEIRRTGRDEAGGRGVSERGATRHHRPPFGRARP